MRVVHVAPTPFGPDAGALLGGGERYPLELARALSRRVECELVTFGTPGVRRVGELTVRTLGVSVRLGGHPAHPVPPSLPAALAGADVIHVHHMRAAPSRIAAVAGRVRRQSVAVTDHGLLGGSWGGALPRLFDAFLLVSRYSARVLSAPPRRTRVIHGGADPERFRPVPRPRRRDLVFVGRITPHKGLDVLIRAVPPDVRLVVAGSEGHDPRPPERDYPRLLRELAEDRDVSFLGPVPEDALPSLYAHAAALVLPSVERTRYGKPVRVTELLGLAAIEAMASGTPVIASRTGGLPEVVVDGETGFLVPPGDVDALRERISQVVSDPELIVRLGRAGRDRVLETFTWDRTAERCVAAYEELLARRS